MRSDQTLALAEDQIRAQIAQERTRLAEAIEAMKRDHSARGRLLSGETLTQIRDLSIESIRKRASLAGALLEGILSSSSRLSTEHVKEVQDAAERAIPADLDDAAIHLRAAVDLIRTPHLLDRLVSAVRTARDQELQKLHSQLALAAEATRQTTRTLFRVRDWLHLLTVAVAASLGIYWMRHPASGVEPALALVMLVPLVIDLLSRWADSRKSR